MSLKVVVEYNNEGENSCIVFYLDFLKKHDDESCNLFFFFILYLNTEIFFPVIKKTANAILS